MSENGESAASSAFNQIVAMSKDENLRRKMLLDRLPVVDLDWDLSLYESSEEPQEMEPEQARWQIFVYQCMKALRKVDVEADYEKMKWNEELVGRWLLLIPTSIYEILGPIGLYPRFWGFLCEYFPEQQYADAKKATISLPTALYSAISEFADLIVGRKADPLNDAEVFMISTVYHGIVEFKKDGETRHAHSFPGVDLLIGKHFDD